jgi:hypothetical protein
MRRVKTYWKLENCPGVATAVIMSKRDYRLMLAVVRAAHEVRRLSGTQVHRGAMDQLEVTLDRFNARSKKK